MATLKIRHLVRRAGKGGAARWYWSPPAALRRQGWGILRLPDDAGAAIAAAEARNAELDAWRAGQAAPGAPAPRPAIAVHSLGHATAAFKADPHWRELAAPTRRQYLWTFDLILTAWGADAPVRAITAGNVRKLHGALAAGGRTPAKANAAIRVLRLLLAFARREGWVADNVAEKPGLRERAAKGRLWSDAAIAAFVAAADTAGWHSVGTAVMVNAWAGQREGDVIALPRSAWRNGRVFVRQSKTGAEVELPIGMVPALAARLDAEVAIAAARPIVATTLLVCDSTGRPWSEHHFRHVVAAIRAAAAAACPEVAGLWFMHLRHTAVARLAEAGATVPEVAAITGHTLGSTAAIIDRYLVRTAKLGRNAFRKRLENADGTQS